MKIPSQIKIFEDLIDLEQTSKTEFTGRSPKYQWGRVYGGQVVAQGLAAAQNTVSIDLKVHSIHAYFIRGGNSDESITYQVDCLRDGKSFATRRVVATQSDGAILNLSASFQLVEQGPDVVEKFDMTLIPKPLTLDSENWSDLMERRVVPVDKTPYGHAIWLKLNRAPLGETRNELGIVYASDDVPFDAAIRMHPSPKKHHH